ncbi:hypothetical protein NQL31_002798 [Lotmaria passim]
MPSASSTASSSSTAFFRHMWREAGRVWSLSDSEKARILSQRSYSSSTHASNATPAAATTARRPTRAFSESGIDQNRDNDVDEIASYNAHRPTGPLLRHEHGRLMIAAEDYDALPKALPTVDFYRRFPRAVGPLANVVVTSAEEYQTLLETCDLIKLVKSSHHRDVARNRLCQKDIDKGGFFVYQPKGERPQYFRLRSASPSSDVYGSSAYIQG